MADVFPNWLGCTVTIIASGPSLTAEDCIAVGQWRARAPGRCVIVINTSFRLAPFADVLYACDAYWWDEYIAEVRSSKFLGELWTQDHRAVDKYAIKLVESQRGDGLGKRHGVIYQGGNSGYQAINFAYYARVKTVVLLGYDMQAKEQMHWHPDHPKGLNVRPFFNSWIPQMGLLAQDLEAVGVDVVNASRATALTCFRRASLEDALA